MEDHIRLKDPDRHKAKLLELLKNEKEDGNTASLINASKPNLNISTNETFEGLKDNYADSAAYLNALQ